MTDVVDGDSVGWVVVGCKCDCEFDAEAIRFVVVDPGEGGCGRFGGRGGAVVGGLVLGGWAGVVVVFRF